MFPKSGWDSYYILPKMGRSRQILSAPPEQFNNVTLHVMKEAHYNCTTFFTVLLKLLKFITLL